VARGEIYGLVGPDGAGKTTTLRAVLGLMTPDSGRSLVAGMDVFAEGRNVRRFVGYVSQAYSLYGDLSVDENMWFFGRMYGLSRRVYRERLERLLEITGLTEFRTRRASALSGGMYKKLALACALLHEPRVLVMDEPTNGVDVMSRRQLWELVSQMAGRSTGVLVATPLMEEAERCHRVGLLSKGRIVLEGRPEELEAGLAGRCWTLEFPGAPGESDAILARPWVAALSVEGRTRLRIVVREGGDSALKSFARGRQARLRPQTPMFEDLYLARMAELGLSGSETQEEAGKQQEHRGEIP